MPIDVNEPELRAVVLTAAGINCDAELAEAFALAGATPRLAHLNEVAADPGILDEADLVGLPGGFSYGDAIAAGRIAAAIMRSTAWDGLRRALDRGVPMIAPCNGFQIAVQLGLLPDPGALDGEPPTPTVALVDNASGRFVDRWCRVEIPGSTCCRWTAGLTGSAATMMMPVAHGEGRFVADPETLRRLDAAGCIAMRYARDDDPNGSAGHVAGICDPSGLVLGLMPHPERYLHWTRHPFWTRLDPADRAAEPPGLLMFRRAVAAARAREPMEA